MSTDQLIVFFAEYLPYLLVLAFLWWALARRARFFAIATGLGAGALARAGVEIIRLFVHRPRPFVADPSIHALFVETSASFPSGHAAFFFALSTVIYAHDKRAGLAFFLASAVVSFARVAAGVHYYSDVAAGALIGIAVGYAVLKFCARYDTLSL